jgi:hypothetical protein
MSLGFDFDLTSTPPHNDLTLNIAASLPAGAENIRRRHSLVNDFLGRGAAQQGLFNTSHPHW